MAEVNFTVKMVRADLENIPRFTAPPGYSVRWFESGDEEAWRRIQSSAEKFHQITPDTFARVFGRNPTWLAQRLCFVVNPRGELVGTGAAWFDDHFEGRKWGRVHWMAVIPGEQGKGLGRVLMTEVCARLKHLKHNNAYLITSSARIAAIRLYRSFGFVPLCRKPEDELIWKAISSVVPPAAQ